MKTHDYQRKETLGMANDMPDRCECSNSPHVPYFNPHCPLHGDPCKFGYTEYDGSKFCHEHRGLLDAGSMPGSRCDTSWQKAAQP